MNFYKFNTGRRNCLMSVIFYIREPLNGPYKCAKFYEKQTMFQINFNSRKKGPKMNFYKFNTGQRSDVMSVIFYIRDPLNGPYKCEKCYEKQTMFQINFISRKKGPK